VYRVSGYRHDKEVAASFAERADVQETWAPLRRQRRGYA
jgi:hypothetical protein